MNLQPNWQVPEGRPPRRVLDEPFPGSVFSSNARAHPDAFTLQDLLALDPALHPQVTRRWVIRGDPGSGKTTLLRHCTWCLAGEPERPWTPIFASLPRLMESGEFLLDAREKSLRRAGHKVEGLAALLDQEGREGRLLVMLDGLDEVKSQDRGEAVRYIMDLSRRWPASPVVVATRPIGYIPFDARFREVDVLPLDDARRREFLSRWFALPDGSPDLSRADALLDRLGGDRAPCPPRRAPAGP